MKLRLIVGVSDLKVLKETAMDNSQIWKLAEQLNIHEVVLLLAGFDPAAFSEDSPQKWAAEVKAITVPFRTIIQNAVLSNTIKAEIKINTYSDEGEIDWHTTLISIASLSDWFRSKNVYDSFFTEVGKSDVAEYADTESSFYAPKLAAAVRAWKEVTSNPELLKSKSPKNALDKWLREHAAEYGLTNDSGNPNNQGIGEICKIANWKPEGGATPTLVGSEKTAGESRKALPSGGRRLLGKPPTRSVKPAPTFVNDDMDIPF